MLYNKVYCIWNVAGLLHKRLAFGWDPDFQLSSFDRTNGLTSYLLATIVLNCMDVRQAGTRSNLNQGSSLSIRFSGSDYYYPTTPFPEY